MCGRREVPGPGPKTRGEAGPRGLQGGPQGAPPQGTPQVRADEEEMPPAVTGRHSPFCTVTPGVTGPAAPSSQFSGRDSRGVVWTPRGWRESGLRVQGGAPTEAECQVWRQGGSALSHGSGPPQSTAGAVRPPRLGGRGQGLVSHPVPGCYSQTPCASPPHLSAQHPQKYKAGPSLG